MSGSTTVATPFCTLLPTYQGDEPEHLDSAIESCFQQTQKPDEILIVEDGPLTPSLRQVLSKWEREHPKILRRHAIPENTGLGNALRVGIEECRMPLVARLDADDLNVKTRFETQREYLANHPGVDVVGGYIDEFTDDPNERVSRRTVPTSHEKIKRMARFRSPMNHGSVMFRRSAVLEAGNYRDVSPMEDYDLWVRLLCNGAKFANIPQTLVLVRAGRELAGRRGGVEYACTEFRQQLEFYQCGFISLPILLFNVLTRVPLRFLPNRIRQLVYSNFLRKTLGSD